MELRSCLNVYKGEVAFGLFDVGVKDLNRADTFKFAVAGTLEQHGMWEYYFVFY